MEEREQDMSTRSSRPAVFLVFGIIAIIIVAGVYFYIRHTRFYISTDDAYVAGRIYAVAPKVAGTIKAVHVDDNQPVRRGDLLVEIDSKDYDVKVDDARATMDAENSKQAEYSMRVDVAEKQLVEIQSRIDAARAAQALQEATLRQAKQDLSRAERLYGQGVVAEATLEKASTAYDVARAQLDAAREQVGQARASLATQKLVAGQTKTALKSQQYIVEQKRQVLASMGLMQGYTKIYSPSDGYITKKNVEVGNQVQAGQPLMSVVPLNDVWIVANYKETQLTDVRPGQRVEVRVDTYPGRTFSGMVDSIMAGTGSVFSLFPPENATGNYVKVVQRIPVKIALKKGADPEHLLRVGMSVVPTIAVKQ
ncbi:MAG TPA: HlyD family secretion protein [Deltaproteobacteria bacterium]|nr:HlyD family secretion protein [Deltaproteobacteria bacterium]